ncbi:unnamed protein product [Phyllotreta striolata]|uniref:Cytoplasmic tRNA 2-thiolation protein 2 n=1 Tax=Phyllotreta striolata TaxID=444603 RepID=A0A9N9TDZ4_PHYSR|nr:unnamed protein product [Phyllotreta striolata]
MCSVGDDFDNQTEKLMQKATLTKLSDTCNKCRAEKPCIVLRGKDTYCKNCFLINTVHKFKASLGKSRLIHLNDRVLVWYQIGHPSVALLHFLRTGLDLSTPKKLRFHPIILFVYDQYQLNNKEGKELIENAKRIVSSFGFDCNFISFADYVSNPENVPNLLNSESLFAENDIEKLNLVIHKTSSRTNRNDIKSLLRKKLLIDVAKYWKCKFVFTPEISIDIASNLLSNISLGRGSHVSIDTGFCDDRDDEVRILKPLRQFDMKELALYNNFNRLESLSVRKSAVNPYSSVQDLMAKFVIELQKDFPATVTTIVKTGDKLSLDKNAEVKCKLCKGPVSVSDDLVTSQQSTNFSRFVSNELVDCNKSRQERFSTICNKFDQTNNENELLCYSCTRIYGNFML